MGGVTVRDVDVSHVMSTFGDWLVGAEWMGYMAWHGMARHDQDKMRTKERQEWEIHMVSAFDGAEIDIFISNLGACSKASKAGYIYSGHEI